VPPIFLSPIKKQNFEIDRKSGQPCRPTLYLWNNRLYNLTKGAFSPLLFSQHGQMYKVLPLSVSSNLNVQGLAVSKADLLKSSTDAGGLSSKTYRNSMP
jgi:hypothetical protein